MPPNKAAGLIYPALAEVSLLQDWVGGQQGLKVFLDPYAEITLATLKPINQQVTLLSGPEGGFAAAERELAKAAGFIPVRLGARHIKDRNSILGGIVRRANVMGRFCLIRGFIAVFTPLWVLLGATILGCIAGYFVIHGWAIDYPFQKVIKKTTQVFLVLGIVPLMALLGYSKADLGFAPSGRYFLSNCSWVSGWALLP